MVAEIGSTTTKVNAFHGLNTLKPKFIGQGQSPTTVLEGDVTEGLRSAIDDLKTSLGVGELVWNEFFAASSAAGGLRMSVHGLVYDMTVRAAKEAALGAGGIVNFVTAGKLKAADVEKLREIRPSMILVAGGVDYGERETSLHNFRLLSGAFPKTPFIYAGNVQNRDEVRSLATKNGVNVYITENVFPAVDTLNVGPARAIIQSAFEDHIINAPGMENIRDLVGGPILPTPGAVMESARLLYDDIGDLLVFDVGGATTDVHSVTEGSPEIASILISPEPLAKRTVEGDLGVYVNIRGIVREIGMEELIREFPDAQSLIDGASPIPHSAEQIRFIETLTYRAVLAALNRHAGTLRDLYGPTGKKTVASGKDLSAVKTVISTGGALTRLPGNTAILQKILAANHGVGLYPPKDARVLTDSHYIMASLGVLSRRYREAALYLLKQSIGLLNS